MKFLPSLFLAGSLALTPSLFAASETVQQILSDAQTAFLRGDLATAKKNFEIVVQADPKNIVAQNYLRIIQQQEKTAPRGSDIEKQLSSVIMPKVEFKEATLGSVFDYLRQQVPKVTGGKTNVNFVLAIPDAQLQGQAVTLQLTNIPFTETLRYLSDLAGLQIEYQKYAIKVTSKGGAPVTTASPLPPGSDTPATPQVPGKN